jgi:hypothetical protein
LHFLLLLLLIPGCLCQSPKTSTTPQEVTNPIPTTAFIGSCLGQHLVTYNTLQEYVALGPDCAEYYAGGRTKEQWKAHCESLNQAMQENRKKGAFSVTDGSKVWSEEKCPREKIVEVCSNLVFNDPPVLVFEYEITPPSGFILKRSSGCRDYIEKQPDKVKDIKSLIQ